MIVFACATVPALELLRLYAAMIPARAMICVAMAGCVLKRLMRNCCACWSLTMTVAMLASDMPIAWVDQFFDFNHASRAVMCSFQYSGYSFLRSCCKGKTYLKLKCPTRNMMIIAKSAAPHFIRSPIGPCLPDSPL